MKTLSICAWIFLFSRTVFGEVGTIPATVTGDNVNLRIGPSRRAEIVGQLPKGTEVRVVLTDGEWSAVIPPEGTAGWISRDYLLDGVVNGSRVNVRGGPSVAYVILLTLEDGAEVSVLEEQEQWAKIKLPDTVRLWLNSRYLSTGPGSIPVEVGKETVRGPASPPVEDPVREVESRTSVPAVPTPSSSALKTAPRPSADVAPVRDLRSYAGIIRQLEQPLPLAAREYRYELVAPRHDKKTIAFLAGDAVDLSAYRFRPVRIWAETVEVRPGHPALLEVKGVGFLW